MRTALSAPTENTVLPSGDRQQSRTGALPSWLTECFCFCCGVGRDHWVFYVLDERKLKHELMCAEEVQGKIFPTIIQQLTLCLG